jgi:hypothetical protein
MSTKTLDKVMFTIAGAMLAFVMFYFVVLALAYIIL